jgi:predicted SnoaL-like aldol condensation-catalyzing enzyme
VSQQTALLHELIERFNRGESIEVERYFTPDFELDDPGAGVNRSGHAGARAMCEALAAIGEHVQLQVLHMLEQVDHVAVRYLATWQGPNAGSAAMIGIYRFADGRIAQDWGVSTRSPWRR